MNRAFNNHKTYRKIILLIFSIYAFSFCIHAQKVSMGEGNVFYICPDSTISAIGENSQYQLGDGTNIDKYLPVKVKGIQNAIAVNGLGQLALLADGTVWQWSGTDTLDSYELKKINIKNVKAISCGKQPNGGKFYCALKIDGTLWFWGDRKTKSKLWWGYTAKIEKVELPKVIKVQGGHDCVIALCEDSTVWTWGFDEVEGNGNLVTYPNYQIFNPQKVNSLSEVVDISAGGIWMSAWALKADGTVWEWGWVNNENYPTKMKINNVKKIFSSSDGQNDSFFALKANDTLIVYKDIRSEPFDFITINYIKNIHSVTACGIGHIDELSIYIYAGVGTIWRWGGNRYGELGNSNTTPINSPEILQMPCGKVNCDTIHNNFLMPTLDTTTFPGVEIILEAFSGASNYSWTPSTNLSCIDCIEPSVLVTKPIKYTVTYPYLYDCPAKEEFIIRIRDCDTIITDPNILVCDTLIKPGSPIELIASDAKSYIWSHPENLDCDTCQSPTAKIYENTEFEVTLTDDYHCQWTERFKITNNCDSTTFYSPEILMDTVTFPNANITFKVSDSKEYTWQPDNGLDCVNCNNPTTIITEPIDYIATLTDSFNCISKVQFKIRIRDCDTIVPNSPVLKLDTVINYVSDIPLEVSKSYDGYQWNQTNGLSCTDCENPILTANETSTYVVETENKWRCKLLEEFRVEVDWQDVIIPNVFTPNSDGINDYFEIKGLLPGSTLKLYDSQGKLVYTSVNYQSDWDGFSNDGEQLNQGTYWYVLQIPEKDNYSGWVFLKKE